jgi:molybdopterin-guanine dinucleotide biosynthesis protein A
MIHTAAVLLAGGKSSRMGTNKALLTFRGKSFLQTIIDAVQPLEIPVYLSGNGAWLHAFGLPVVRDLAFDQGPVVALASCFSAVQAEQMLVLSCDVPQLSSQHIKRLLSEHTLDTDVTLYRSGGKDLPLVAVYSKSAFPYFEHAMNTGDRKLLSVIAKLKVKRINDNGNLKNINTPKDLEAIQ